MNYKKFEKVKHNKSNVIDLSNLTDEQKKQMKVNHYTVHIPAYASCEQLEFINEVAKDVIGNEAITIVHEHAMQNLLRWAYSYRNLLVEFDEERRWTNEDDMALRKISREFAPILEWLKEQYKLNVQPFERD